MKPAFIDHVCLEVVILLVEYLPGGVQWVIRSQGDKRHVRKIAIWLFGLDLGKL